MKAKTAVFFKQPGESKIVNLDLTPYLGTEAAQSISLGQPSVVSPTPLVAVASGTNPVQITLSGGDLGTSYGMTLTVTTQSRVIPILVAVTVQEPELIPQYQTNSGSYQDLVDTIEAGNAALGTAVFSFPVSIDPTGGYVEWNLLDSDGVLYASGNAFEYKIKSNGLSNIVMAQCLVNVPSGIPPSLEGQKYQLRYQLTVEDQQYFAYENISVVGLNTVPLGAMPQVELQGQYATVSLVTDKLYENVSLQIVVNNEPGEPVRLTDFERVANGYYWSAVIDTNQFQVSLEPYMVQWKYYNSPAQVFSESAPLYVINASIESAIQDMKAKINKAQTTLYGTPDMLFPPEVIMTWLRRGSDAFNGYKGIWSDITFTNAKGGYREYWLMFAEIGAIEAQYLAEGEKAFNFSGQAISLDIDRTSFLDSAMSRIQSRLDQEFEPFKKNLIIKGNQGGDGSANPGQLRQGAIGSVGIVISPASMWNSMYPGRSFPVRY